MSPSDVLLKASEASKHQKEVAALQEAKWGGRATTCGFSVLHLFFGGTLDL